MIRACIFDLDGTLLETLTSLWYCSNESLRKEGLGLLPKENFRYYVGDGARTQVERYLKDTRKLIGGKGGSSDAASLAYAAPSGELNPGAYEHDPHDPDDFEYYYDSYMRELSKNATYEVKPYEGIPELLQALLERGIRLAVFSNKPDAATQRIIREIFGDMFEEVLGKRDENPKKPDPAGVHMILRKLGAMPEETLYFGDTNTDMYTGRNAGAFTIGVTWGFRDRKELEDAGADAIIDHPLDALKYLK